MIFVSSPLDYQGKKKKTKVHKKWLDSDCLSLRKQLNLLSNKKHRNPFDSNLRHDYHLAKKNFKKLIKHKKLKLFNSRIDDLTQNKDNQKFWTFLKTFKENQTSPSNNQDIPVDNLFKQFKQLHLHSDPSSVLLDQISFKENLSNLKQKTSTTF